MRFLHLDQNFKPNGFDIKYKKFKFPGGETYIKIQDDFLDEVTISQIIKNGDDIIEIILAVDALKRLGITQIDLFTPYIPYARQDRIMIKGESLSIKVFADIINSMNFRKVYVFDPHSDVAPALINNCYIINNHHFIKSVLKKIKSKNITLICPDSGAVKKIKDLARYLKNTSFLSTIAQQNSAGEEEQINFNIIKCDKTRNIETGEITGFIVYTNKLLINQDCIIIDDICDGGGTFIGLAKEIKKWKPRNLYLAVSHGIFSGDMELLNSYFSQIFTTNSFCAQKETYQLNLEI